MVVDFASALLMPAWLARSPLGRQLRRSDLANVVKLQSRLTGTVPSRAEAAALAEPRWVRPIRNAWKRLYRVKARARGANLQRVAVQFAGAYPPPPVQPPDEEIGRASYRERVGIYVEYTGAVDSA